MNDRARAPRRIRSYRVTAEPKQTPDLHKLAQLFIGMAQHRAQQQAQSAAATPSSKPPTRDEPDQAE